MSDEGNLIEIECFDECRKIIGIGIQIVAPPGLTRTTVTTTVVGNDTVSVLPKKQHLSIPRIGAERPSMGEDDRFAGAPVFEVKPCPIFGGDRIHLRSS
jgi:hypothetical protein